MVRFLPGWFAKHVFDSPSGGNLLFGPWGPQIIYRMRPLGAVWDYFPRGGEPLRSIYPLLCQPNDFLAGIAVPLTPCAWWTLQRSPTMW